MSSNATNRETSRDKLATLFTNALTGVGKPVQSVFAYRTADFAGASPVVLVVSAGSLREQHTRGAMTINRSGFQLDVLNFVAAANVDAGWTEADVEDRLDLIEKMETDVIADNRGKANDASLPWDYIETEEGSFSQLAPVKIGGAKFWLEGFTVVVTVKD